MSDINIENKLIKNLIRGDAYSFDQIFDKYNKRVYAFSLSNLKNKEDAEGVVQEVFLSLWKDRKKLKELKNLEAWIFSICFNVIRKRFRKLARERKHLEKFAETILTADNSTLTEVEYNDLQEKANTIIEKLSPRQKTIFLMSRNKGLSNAEISNQLNISKKTVENHLTNAKAFLKETFLDEHLLTILFFWLFLK
ncbi:MAG: RNA polymerase sigma-70 factor [Bacteroidota bacterium]